MFTLFNKLEQSRDINKGGLGLGLTICKNLSSQLGGSIDVKSKFGEGTTFSFTFKDNIMIDDHSDDIGVEEQKESNLL